MAQTRLTYTLTRADEPACPAYARVTIVDCEASRSGSAGPLNWEKAKPSIASLIGVFWPSICLCRFLPKEIP